MCINKFHIKILLMLLLSVVIGCADDEITPPDTSDTAAPANVTDLAVLTSTDSSATLTWTCPGDDGASGTASEYDIRYSTAVVTAANFGSATQAANLPIPSTAGTGETFTVTGLTGNTTYYFAQKTADEVANWSGLSNVANATTPPQFLTKWGSPGTGIGQFEYPVGIAVDGSGNVYVTDRDINRIQKFDGNGTFLWMWGSQGTADGQLKGPRGIAVDGSGNVYVADAQNQRIQKFDGTGTFLTKWGSQGTGDGQFILPLGIAIDGSDNIYVVDRANNRIQKFK